MTQKLFSILFIAFLLLTFTTPITQAREFNLTPGQQQMLSNLEAKDLLRFACGKVYIHETLWTTMTYQVKKDFAATLAIACAERRDVDTYWVKLHGLYSGRKLASWSQSRGFSVSGD